MPKFIDIASAAPSPDDLSKIPEQGAKEWRVIFVRETKSGVVVATDEPAKAGLADFLKAAFPKKKVEIYFAFPEDITNALSHYQKELNTRFSEIIQKEKRVAPEIFEEIVKDAISYRASDIHFEPQSGKTIVRFRMQYLPPRLSARGSLRRKFSNPSKARSFSGEIFHGSRA